MGYEGYTSHDFALDESFRRWVLEQEQEASVFWEEWLQHHPHKQQEVSEARDLLESIKFQNYPEPEQELQQIWGKLRLKAMEDKQLRQSKLNQTKDNRWFYFKIAASFSGILLIAGFIFFQFLYNDYNSYRTTFGEIRTVVLPDNTLVTLNANSQLKVPKDFLKNPERTVRLEGEAFFEVSHRQLNNAPQKFLVNAGELDVAVIGTRFNVNNRRRVTEVVLNSGMVKLELDKNKKGGSVTMLPGELIRYSGSDGNMIRRKVKAEQYSAWTENLLILDDTSLSELVQILEDRYGYTIAVEDEELMRRAFTGTYPTNDLDILFSSLELAFNLSVIRNDNQIIIKVKK
jgi:ferric-dicitrate binding protein FerR (iron transport regulator)